MASSQLANCKLIRARGRSSATGIGNAGLRRPSTTHSRPQPMRRRRPERGLAQLAGYEAFVRKLPHWGDKRLSSGSRRHFRVETWSFTRECVSVENFTDFFGCFSSSNISAGRVPAELGLPRLRDGARRLSQRCVRCRARCCVHHHTASPHIKAGFSSNPPR